MPALPPNPPGPYILDIPYQCSGFFHHFTCNLKLVGDPAPGTAPADINVETRGATDSALDNAVNDLWTLVRQLGPSTNVATNWTVWKVNNTTTEKLYISSGDLSPANFAAPAAPTLASYVICSWRSVNGGTIKLEVMEPHWARNDKVPLLSTGVAAFGALNTFILSDDNFVLARDRSWPAAPINASFGQNEKLFKRRYRSS